MGQYYVEDDVGGKALHDPKIGMLSRPSIFENASEMAALVLFTPWIVGFNRVHERRIRCEESASPAAYTSMISGWSATSPPASIFMI